MDILSGIIFVILFLVIMLFAFSMGVLSPLVGRKELASIVAIGFVLGVVGGTFFIYPIYEEVPYVAGTFQELFSDCEETINIDVSSASNISELSSEISKQDGVNSVSTNGFELRTDTFNRNISSYIEKHLKSEDSIKSYSVNSGFINVNLDKGYKSTSQLKSLVNWLSSDAGVISEFAIVHLQVKVKSSSVLDIKNYLEDSQKVSVSSVEGPVQDTIANYKSSALSEASIVVICGAIGIFVSLLGIYIDTINKIFKKISLSIRRKI